MEEKVVNALNLVQKDGDSFAKRAEMYYKHRPELIAFIEETVRAYRALAERYDKLSTDLQNANTTIASVFPYQLPYDTDYDDDDNSSLKMPKKIGPDPPKAPKVPKGKDLKGLLTNANTKIQAKKVTKADQLNHVVLKSGLTKEEAVEEIDKLQKDILSMQTMKEFTKSSYENGLARFWELENKVMELQQRVCALQDEFKVAKGIEDDDARAIMAEAALKSCEEALAKLLEKQEKSNQDARLEHERIQKAKQKLRSLKHDYLPDKADEEEEHKLEKELQNSNESEQKELQAKIEESVEELSKKPFTVTEMEDTVDKLVNKVISLEMLVSSQTAFIDRLRIETDDLQTQIRNLEDDKANLIDGAYNLEKTLKDMEKKLNGVQDLDNDIENQNNRLKTQFTEACCNLEHLSENLHNVKPDVEAKLRGSSLKQEDSTSKEQVEEKEIPCTNDGAAKNVRITRETREVSEKNKDSICTNGDRTTDLNTGMEIEKDDRRSVDDELAKPKFMRLEGEHQTIANIKDEVLKPESQEEGEKDKTNWQELLLSGLEDKEKVLLQEYTTILRKYKVAKKELAEEEQKNQGTVIEMKLQVRDLKTLQQRQ